jgi:uncharacterized protein (TIGR02145 family)
VKVGPSPKTKMPKHQSKTRVSIKRSDLFVILSFFILYSIFQIPNFNIAHAAIINSSKISTNGGDTLKNGLVGWWTFDGDKMKNNVADSSGNGNNGNMVGFTSTSSAVVAGKLGQGLKFDGVDDYVNISNPSSFGFADATFSVSFWTKMKSSSGVFLGKDGSGSGTGGWAVDIGSNKLEFFGKTSGAATAFSRSSSSNVNDDKWHHAVAVFTTSTTVISNNTITIYLDGVLNQGTLTQTSTYAAGNNAMYLGNRGGLDYYLDGYMDDVRIYNRALSAAEIKQLYNLGGTKTNTVSTVTAGGDTLKSGLVGWWTFDGANMKNNVTDSSGNGNNGHLVNFGATSTAVVAGKLGQGLNFDGTDDRIEMNTDIIPNDNFTISAWVRPVNYKRLINPTVVIVSKLRNTLLIDDSYPGFKFHFQRGDTYETIYTNTIFTSNDKWYHVVVTKNGGSAGNTKIYVNGVQDDNGAAIPSLSDTYSTWIGSEYLSYGSGHQRDFPGQIDDVRIYNRALSAAEVKQLYNLGGTKTNTVSTVTAGGTTLKTGLVGWWTFDGANMKNNVTDSSGNGNNGHMSGFTSTSTAVVAGKLGQGLKFDGANDYVDVNDASSLNPTSQVTLSSWVKTNSSGGYIVAKDPIALRQAYSVYPGSSISSVTVLKDDLLVVTYSGYVSDYTTFTCSDNASGGSNAYIPITGFESLNLANARMFYAVAKNSEILNVACTGVVSDAGMSIHVYSDIDTSNPLDPGYGTSYSGDSCTLTSGNITTTSTDNEVIVAFFAQESILSTFSDWTNSFVGETEKSSHVHVTADRIVNSKGTYSTGMTTSACQGGGWIMASFNQVSGGGAEKTSVPYALSTVNGGEFLINNGGTPYTVDSSVNVSDGKWHHLVGTYDGTTMKIYVDGVNKGSSWFLSGSLPTQAGNMRIGADYETFPSNFWNGSLDDIRIYNRALSDAEVAQLYNMSANKTISMQLFPCGAYSVTGQDGLTYGTVVGEDGRCWLDRNLGATRVATAYNDSSAYGDYYQWGRLYDGHQVVTSDVTFTGSSGDVPNNGGLFIATTTSPYNWRNSQNNNLWQGVNGTNNPCPTGFRLPTQTEWVSLFSVEGITNSATAFSSSLKLPGAGGRYSGDGGLTSAGNGIYWSSSLVSTNIIFMAINYLYVTTNSSGYPAFGLSVRCIKD